MKLLKGLAWGVAIEAAAVGIFVGAEAVQGTRFVLPFLAMVGLPLLAFTFPERPKRRRYR